MDRLTSDKHVLDMNSRQLAHNCCYVSDGNARYRDKFNDVDCRNLIREICKKRDIWKDTDEVMTDDNILDDIMMDYLQYHYNTDRGLIALLYRNMWAMAELRETLKQYEDAEQSGELVRLPVKIGDTVYTSVHMSGWYMRAKDRPYEAKVVYIGVNGTDNYMNVEIARGKMLQFSFSEIGKRVFLTREAAEQALSKVLEGK